MLQDARDALASGKVTRETINERARATSQMMVMRYYEDGRTEMHTMNGVLSAKYKIVARRPRKGELDIDVLSARHGTEEGTIKFEGGLMTLRSRGGDAASAPSITLKRISEEDAKLLIKKISQSKQVEEGKEKP